MKNDTTPAEGKGSAQTESESALRGAACPLCNDSGSRIIGERDGKHFWNRCAPCECRKRKKEKVVAHESMMRLVRDLEGWANARIIEYKEAKQQGRFMPYHDQNYFCAMGQLDAADRIRDVLREESFVVNSNS